MASSSGWNGAPGPCMIVAPRGTRDIDSTPPPMVISQVPAWIRFAAKWIACWLEPHWRSTVVAGVSYGKSAVRRTLRATLAPCSPTWSTQPNTTSSTSDDSMPARRTTSFRTSAPRLFGWMPDSTPARRPMGVRTASTMTTSLTERLL